jgi:NAD(P)-dependent dehydrogenase (short-subunit alcohol dehydrogenase family)
MAVPRRLTEDGFEEHIGVNHLGHFALTGLLLPLLLRGGEHNRDARVVVTSSNAHRFGDLNLGDLMSEQAYGRWRTYGQSKLANLLYVRELDRRLRERHVPLLAVAAHPGYAATNLQSGQGSRLLEGAMHLANMLFAQDERPGAWPQLYAGTMPDVQGGEYLGPDGRGQMRGNPTRVGRSAAAQDDVAARRLWERSEQLTGVSYDAIA